MERLTKKEKKVVVLNNRNIGKNYLTIKQYEKLQQLENIEEELGIDLITLFRALNSCWFKYNFEIIGDIRPSLRFINGEWCLISNIERIAFPYPLRLYGKAWSLDRSELENE